MAFLFVALIACAAEFYVFFGYRLLLSLIVRVRGLAHTRANWGQPQGLPLTVVLAVYREAWQLEERIENILGCSYRYGHLVVIVASDGSDSEMAEIVKSMADDRVQYVQTSTRLGKSGAQNEALRRVAGGLVLFTDADTRFDPEFLEAIARPFSDPVVGAVSGHLMFRSSTDGRLEEGQTYYWNEELRVRRLESRMGLLAVASGACVAVRRCLVPLLPDYVGEDCIIPLEVVAQGFKTVHEDNARCWDVMPAEVSQEFRSRIRMTLRNWQGTLVYKRLLNPLRYPGYSFALLSHKILRWCSPVFLLLLLAGVVQGASMGAWWGYAGTAAVLLICAACVVGYWTGRHRVRVVGLQALLGFCVANTAFAVALLSLARRRKVRTYRT